MDSISVCVEISSQQLHVFSKANALLKSYPVSTAAQGVGEKIGSFQTPRGLHEIRAKIGAGAPLNAIFIGRRETGKIYSLELDQSLGKKDWILTRILWLRGLEKGKNRLGACDTMRRYIYIHGTSNERDIGKAVSYGCIRMCNQDVIELFEWVQPGTKVLINE